jgi:glycyl-tRNA synthetase (EC 6.1.1.14)
VLEHSYHEEPVEGEMRVVLRFLPGISPIDVAILPLMDKDELVEPARRIFDEFRRCGMLAEFDTSGSIGRRYRRNDEIGTPYCITVDYQTLEDGTVTVRDRDTMQQIRIEADRAVDIIRDLMSGALCFSEAGMPVKS